MDYRSNENDAGDHRQEYEVDSIVAAQSRNNNDDDADGEENDSDSNVDSSNSSQVNDQA